MVTLSDVDIRVVQKRPYTCVTINDGKQDYVGFSKVCWPDEWNARTGLNLALGKAVAEMFNLKPPQDGERVVEHTTARMEIKIKADNTQFLEEMSAAKEKLSYHPDFDYWTTTYGESMAESSSCSEEADPDKVYEEFYATHTGETEPLSFLGRIKRILFG